MGNDCQPPDSDLPAVRLEAFPGPAARYDVRDDEVVLRRTNERFDAVFATSETETRWRRWWTENDVSARDCTVSDICSSLLAGETVDVTVTVGCVDETAYRLRSVHEPGPTAEGTLALSAGPDVSRDALDGEQIASIISHDLRNPLDVAKARLRAARETGEAEHFDRLERAHGRMERIIKDVLTLARNGEVINPSQAVALDAVATDAWATVETGTATLALADDLPSIRVDRDRVRRLFENLFRNSIEHSGGASDPQRTEQGTTTGITVRVGWTDDIDGFFVADDGPGVPEEDRERVFDPGYTAADGGTGLGLTIVERIAAAHGWTVRLVESDDGGARFEFVGVASDPERTDVEKS